MNDIDQSPRTGTSPASCSETFRQCSPEDTALAREQGDIALCIADLLQAQFLGCIPLFKQMLCTLTIRIWVSQDEYPVIGDEHHKIGDEYQKITAFLFSGKKNHTYSFVMLFDGESYRTHRYQRDIYKDHTGCIMCIQTRDIPRGDVTGKNTDRSNFARQYRLSSGFGGTIMWCTGALVYVFHGSSPLSCFYLVPTCLCHCFPCSKGCCSCKNNGGSSTVFLILNLFGLEAPLYNFCELSGS